MLYVIKYSDGSYFHNKGRIILYESQQQAIRFLESFIQYSINRLAQEGVNGLEIMQVPMIVQNRSSIEAVDFDIDKVKCGTVYATDL